MNGSMSLLGLGAKAPVLDPPCRAPDADLEDATNFSLGTLNPIQKARFPLLLIRVQFSFLLLLILGIGQCVQAEPDNPQRPAGDPLLISSSPASRTDPTLEILSRDTTSDSLEAEDGLHSRLSAYFSRSEPLTAAMWYSATQFVVRKAALGPGTQIRIDGPPFSAHRLQAEDKSAPNHIGIKLPPEIPHQIERLAQSTSLVLTIEAELRSESVFEIEYEDILRSPADLSPLKLPLHIRADSQSSWKQVPTEERAVIAGPATRLELTAPAFVQQRQAFDLSIRALDQFGHPSPTQPRSLDLRREGRLLGQLSSEENQQVILSSQTLNQRTITRFEARTPGGGLRGTSDWITVSAAPEALIWTDFSETSLEALPRIDSTKLSAFEGDDQAGLAQRLTLLKPLTVDESALTARRLASLEHGNDEDSIETMSQGVPVWAETSSISGDHDSLLQKDAIKQQRGLVTEPQTSMNQGKSFHDLMLFDRPSGESLGEESGAKSGEGADRTVDSERSLNSPDQAPFSNHDGDSVETEGGATGDPSPMRLARSAQDFNTQREEETAPTESDPVLASGGYSDESASIRPASMRASSREGALLEPPDRVLDSDKSSNNHNFKEISLEQIAKTGASASAVLDAQDLGTKVRYDRHWEGVGPDGEVAFLHTGNPETAWRIARPENTTDRRWGRMRGAVIAQGTSAYPWLIDYIAQQGEPFSVITDRVSATGEALGTGPWTGIWAEPDTSWLEAVLGSATFISMGDRVALKFRVNGGSGRVLDDPERQLDIELTSQHPVLWVDWYKNGERLKRQFFPSTEGTEEKASEGPSDISTEIAREVSGQRTLALIFESSSSPIAPGITPPRNAREWLGYLALEGSGYELLGVQAADVKQAAKTLMSREQNRVDFLTRTHGAPSVLRFDVDRIEVSDLSTLEGRSADASIDQDLIEGNEDAAEELSLTSPASMSLLLSSGVEDALFLDLNRLPATIPSSTFQFLIGDLALSPASREVDVAGYRDRVTLTWAPDQGAEEVQTPVRRSIQWTDRSPSRPGDYYWTHVLMLDGTSLWSSPVFVGGGSLPNGISSAENSLRASR